MRTLFFQSLLLLTVSFCCVKTSFAVERGALAINFTLPEITGGEINLEDYKGQVVYLDFWASWCKPCVQSFPALDELRAKFKAQGFEVIAVNLDHKLEKAEQFIHNNPVSYPLAYDQQATVAKAYNVQAMPSGFFIDRKGIIRLVHKGFNKGDEKKIEKAIKLLLSESP